jgi:hypothetical protein
MKTLNLEQMQQTSGGKFLNCVAQVAGGMGILGTIASIGIWSLGPVGWGIFILSSISFAADAVADPYACG